jgi:20S proteasome subunit alpha 4
VRGTDSIVIAVEKKSVPLLQDDRTIRKIHRIDEHVILAFAGAHYYYFIGGLRFLGLSADARVLVDMCRIECQSYKLTVEDPVTIAYITKFIANTKEVCLNFVNLFFKKII